MSIFELLKDDINEEPLLAAVQSPNWEDAAPCQNWKNYIPNCVRRIWDELTTEAKVVAFLVAEEQARNENWD
jgi:hypothetical protein